MSGNCALTEKEIKVRCYFMQIKVSKFTSVASKQFLYGQCLTKMLVISSYMNLFPKMHISATTPNCHVIRLQVNISLYILRTFLFTFLLELTGRICLTIRSILNW